MAETIKIGRLALRDEGDVIKAYYAKADTMDEAVTLFALNPSVAHLPGVRDAALKFGRHIVSEILFEITGERPIWPHDPEPAPEHERTGKA